MDRSDDIGVVIGQGPSQRMDERKNNNEHTQRMEEERKGKITNKVDGEAHVKAIDAWRYWWCNRTVPKAKNEKAKKDSEHKISQSGQ
jgi:hypothetical protein